MALLMWAEVQESEAVLGEKMRGKEASLFQTAVSGSYSISSNRFVSLGNNAAARKKGRINRKKEITSPICDIRSWQDRQQVGRENTSEWE